MIKTGKKNPKIFIFSQASEHLRAIYRHVVFKKSLSGGKTTNLL